MEKVVLMHKIKFNIKAAAVKAMIKIQRKVATER